MNILVTGNYCTGSSAVYDYLKEFKNIQVPFSRDGYEHTIFYMPYGLIDLENTLFGNVGYIAQDSAIRNFIQMSENIYKYNYKYYGGFNKTIGKAFLDMTYEFVNSFARPFNARTIGKNEKMRFSLIKACGQIVFAMFKKYKIESFGMAYKEKKGPGYVLYVNHEQFNKAKEKYIAKYLELTSKNGYISLYDHLLLPINSDFIKFFPSDSKLIIVDRDPRDVYCLIKSHIMTSAKFGYEKPPFPIATVEEFIDSYNMFRTNYDEYKKLNENILFIQFEELVINYDKTTEKIRKFLNIDESNHTTKLKYFDPSISVNNIKLFEQDYNDDIKKIEKELSKYIYDFKSNDIKKIIKKESEVF